MSDHTESKGRAKAGRLSRDEEQGSRGKDRVRSPELFRNPFYEGKNNCGYYGEKDDFNCRMEKTIRRVGRHSITGRAFKMKLPLGIFSQRFEYSILWIIFRILVFC
jgi:hypothetical protein